MLDAPREVQPGEELPADKLRAYLAAHFEPASVASSPELLIRQFPSGYSNLTYAVFYGGREMVLRRPPFGSKVKSAHDMGREFRILSRLSAVYARAPRPLLFCDDESVLGAKFYIMERLSGVILRRQIPPELKLGPAEMTALGAAFLETLIELHAIDYQAIGLGELGRPQGYVERQVSGWTKRYRDAQTSEVPAVERILLWLADHLPTSSAPTLLHNDYKLDNLVLDAACPTRIIGVLDWEMAAIGDPLMDLGTALCYWVQASDTPALRSIAFGPTTLPGCMTRQELVARYSQRTGRSLLHIVFYYCFGLFKTAVVAQQIYYRYKQGLTKDARFSRLGLAVAILAEQAVLAIDKDAL